MVGFHFYLTDGEGNRMFVTVVLLFVNIATIMFLFGLCGKRLREALLSLQRFLPEKFRTEEDVVMRRKQPSSTRNLEMSTM